MDFKARRFNQFHNLNLRVKVTLGVVLPLVLILGIFTVIEYSRHQSVVITNLSLLASHSGQVIESNLRHQMLKSDFAELQALLDTIGDAQEFQNIYLLDKTGRVIFAPHETNVGLLMDNRQPECQPCHRLAAEARPASVVVRDDDGQRVFRSMHPIENSPACAQCHDPQERLIGLLLTDIPMAPVEAPLAAHLRESLLWWAGTIFVTVVVVNMTISRLVLRRLERLAAAISRFGRGQLSDPLADDQPDEIGQLAVAFNDMATQVESRSEENRNLTESLRRQSAQRGELLKNLITAQEDERIRVARELHDELGQALGGLSFRTEAVQSLLTSDMARAAKELDQTQALIKETTDQMYDLILALRPAMLDDLGLGVALRAQAERTLTVAGINFQINDNDLKDRLSPEIETALYRIYQEALSNIVRHAGATQVQLSLACQNGIFEGEISDDGQGFDPDHVHIDGEKPRGLGLMGMQERLALIGGQLEIHSQPGRGTCLRIYVKLEEYCCD